MFNQSDKFSKDEIFSNKIANGSEQNHTNNLKIQLGDKKKKYVKPASTKNSTSNKNNQNFLFKGNKVPIPSPSNTNPKNIYNVISNPVISEENNLFESSREHISTHRTFNSRNSATRSLSEKYNINKDDQNHIGKNFESFGKDQKLKLNQYSSENLLYISRSGESRNFFIFN